ncbi:MAG: hypothetical protein ACO1SX_24140 [Actinomycetota bacterium]
MSLVGIRFVPMAAALATLALSSAAHAQKSLENYTQPALKDLSASVDVLSHNDGELRKIGKGYVDAYKLARQEIQCREPSQMRFQGKKGLFTIRYVTNGSRKLTEVPTLRIRKVEDIAKEPGKGDSISDLGVITPAWADRVEARWVRTENKGGNTLQVFEFWYKEDPRRRHTISIDPDTKTIVEHIDHHRSKKKPGFRKRLVFSQPKQVNGVWLPTRAALYNGENKLSAEVKYESIQVNTGLSEKLFKF